MHDKQYMLNILDTTPQIIVNVLPKSVVEEWHDKFQNNGDENVLASQVDEKLLRSFIYRTGQDKSIYRTGQDKSIYRT
jgi:hypothetical protein